MAYSFHGRKPISQAVEFRERQEWAKLPIYNFKNEIVSTINSNRITVVKGFTGCGKSTQIPQYIADDCQKRNLPYNIVVAQPRRFAAKSLAERVANEIGCTLGEYVGYHIGLDKNKNSSLTKILYCTTGVLLQNFIMSGSSKVRYTHILVDEVHERSADLDMLLLALKKRLLMEVEFDLTIVLMSATFDYETIRNYFVYSRATEYNKSCDIHPAYFDISGAITESQNIYTRETYYLEDIIRKLEINSCHYAIENTVDPSVRQVSPNSSQRTLRDKIVFDQHSPLLNLKLTDVVIKILKHGIELGQIPGLNKGTVLIFLPGLAEIINLHDSLLQSGAAQTYNWKFFILHSTVSLKDQSAVMMEPTEGLRNIILSTNIAESSLTVPNVEFVIDFCLQKSIGHCRQAGGYNHLTLEWASKSACDQRAGRTGRTNCGLVFRLVPKSFYKSFRNYEIPEFEKIPLENYILKAKLIDLNMAPREVLAIAINPPKLSDIEKSVLTLKRVGALSIQTAKTGSDLQRGFCYEAENGDLTTLGFFMAFLPLEICLSKLIALGLMFDVTFESVVIAAAHTTPGIFLKNAGDPLQHYKSVLSWSNRSFSDSLAFLRVYRIYKALFSKNRSSTQAWCQDNNIEFQRMCELETLITEVLCRMNQFFKIDFKFDTKQVYKHQEQELILKCVLAGAFYPNYFQSKFCHHEILQEYRSDTNFENTLIMTNFDNNNFFNTIYMPALKDLFKTCSYHFDFVIDSKQVYMVLESDRYKLSANEEGHPLSISYNSHIDFSKVNQNWSKLDIFKNWSNLQDTSLPTTVYLALAVRKINDERLSLKRFSKNVEEAYQKELIDMVCRLFPRYNQYYDEGSDEDDDGDLRHEIINGYKPILVNGTPVKCVLPSMSISPAEFWLPVRISHFVCPRLFYCLYEKDYVDDMFANLRLLTIALIKLVREDNWTRDEQIAAKTIHLGDYLLYPVPTNRYPSLKHLVQYYELKTFLVDGQECIFSRAQVVKVQQPNQRQDPEDQSYYSLFFPDFGFSESVVLNLEKCFKLNVYKMPTYIPNSPIGPLSAKKNRIAEQSYTKICEYFLHIPALAVKSELVRVRPALVGSSEGWTPAINKFIIETCQSFKFTFKAKIYAFLKNILYVELFQKPDVLGMEADQLMPLSMDDDKHDEDYEEQFSLNQLLVSKNLAEFKIESELSHLLKMRQRLNTKRRAPIKMVLGEDSVQECFRMDLDRINVSHDTRFSSQRIHFSGPISPLELEFFGLSNNHVNKVTKVSQLSVNVVALEPNLNVKHSRLLVAGNVTSNISNDTVTLNETTLMPNIIDFASFMCLVFAPVVELRINKMLPKYCEGLPEEVCGAICGIGFDPRNSDSLDITGDIDFLFESSISIDDIRLVNGLRYLMGRFFKNRTISQINGETFSGLFQIDPNSLADYQAKARGMMLKLLGRQRINRKWLYNQNTCFTPFNYRWNLFDDTSALTLTKYRQFSFRAFNTFVQNDIDCGLFIWFPINEPKLDNESEDSWEMVTMKNLNLIEKCVDNDSIPSNSALNLCKLCMFKTTSRAEMRAHIHGEERESFVHQERSYIFKHFYYLVLKKRDNDMDDGNRSNQVDNEFLKEIELPFSEPDAIMEERPEHSVRDVHGYRAELSQVRLFKVGRDVFGNPFTEGNFMKQMVDIVSKRLGLKNMDIKQLIQPENDQVVSLMLEYFDMDYITLMAQFINK